MIKFINLLAESSYIDPSEATSDIKAIGTLVDNKRNICFLVRTSNNENTWKKIQEIIKKEGLKQMYVKGNPGDAYVVYRPGSENKATRLKDIAEKYGGYLSYEATDEETREIGRLLNYNPDKVEEFIKKNKDVTTGKPVEKNKKNEAFSNAKTLTEIEFNSKLADKFEWSYEGGKDSKYIFNTGTDGDSGIDYQVVFVDHDGSGIYERIYRPVGSKDFRNTNEGKPIKINATVMDITLDFMNRNKDWHELLISPIDSRRYNLVKSFVDRSVPKSKYLVTSEEGIITITRTFSYAQKNKKSPSLRPKLKKA